MSSKIVMKSNDGSASTFYIGDDYKLKSIDKNNTVTSYGLADDSIIPALANDFYTRTIEGGYLSINAINPAKFDISSAILGFTDNHLNPDDPYVLKLDYSGATSVVNPRLATHDYTIVMIDKDLNLYFRDIFDGTDQTDLRNYCGFGILVHPSRTQIDSVVSTCVCTPTQIGVTLSDLTVALGGFINLKNGNVYSGVSGSLQLKKSTGYLFGIGINKSNVSNPNILTNVLQNPSSIIHTCRNGSGGFTDSSLGLTINPARYDDNTVATSGLPNGVVGTNEWSVRYLYFTTTYAYVQYGQYKYSSFTDAVTSINKVIHSENPTTSNTLFRGWLVVRGGATDLSLSTDAVFYSADRFGTHIVTGGLPTNTTNLQGAYNNSIEPEIKIDTTHGAVTIRDADTPTGGNLFEVQTSSPYTNVWAVSASQNTFGKKVRLENNGIAWDDLRVGGTLRTAGTIPAGYEKLTALGTVYAYKFDATKVEELFCTVQMPHNWKEGTDIIPHIHWTTEDSNAGNIVWGIEYTWSNYLGTFTTTSSQEVTSANSTAFKHNLTNFNTLSGTGKTLSSVLIIRLFRNGASGADTYGSDASLLEFDIHYQIDSFGSDTVTSKT